MIAVAVVVVGAAAAAVVAESLRVVSSFIPSGSDSPSAVNAAMATVATSVAISSEIFVKLVSDDMRANCERGYFLHYIPSTGSRKRRLCLSRLHSMHMLYRKGVDLQQRLVRCKRRPKFT